MRLQQGDHDAARADLTEMLGLMRARDDTYFFGWLPHVMEAILREAVAAGIERAFAQRLAFERLNRAILPDGTPLPVLDLRLLGDLQFSVDGEAILDAAALTPAQRDLITLLAAADNLSLSQEQLQLAFWPDASTEKARANFDGLLARTRKSLSAVLKPHGGKQYLSLEKSILSLRHCRVDTHEFMRLAQEGLDHARRDNLWQGRLTLEATVRRWTGEPWRPAQHTEGWFVFTERLRGVYREAGLQLAALHEGRGEPEAAIEALQSVFENEPTDPRIATELHRLHLKKGDTLQARRLEHRYQQALEQAGCEEDEAEELLDGLWAG